MHHFKPPCHYFRPLRPQTSPSPANDHFLTIRQWALNLFSTYYVGFNHIVYDYHPRLWKQTVLKSDIWCKICAVSEGGTSWMIGCRFWWLTFYWPIVARYTAAAKPWRRVRLAVTRTIPEWNLNGQTMGRFSFFGNCRGKQTHPTDFRVYMALLNSAYSSFFF